VIGCGSGVARRVNDESSRYYFVSNISRLRSRKCPPVPAHFLSKILETDRCKAMLDKALTEIWMLQQHQCFPPVTHAQQGLSNIPTPRF